MIFPFSGKCHDIWPECKKAFPKSTFEISECKKFSPIHIHSIRNCTDFPQHKLSFLFGLWNNAMIKLVYLIHKFLNFLPNYSSYKLCFTSPSTFKKEFQYSFSLVALKALSNKCFPRYKVTSTTDTELIPRFESRANTCTGLT